MGASFLNLVTTKVTVKGEEQKFVSLRLHQRFNRHHAFTVIVNYLSPGNTFKQTPEKFINYIGETVSISFAHKQTGESYDFEGGRLTPSPSFPITRPIGPLRSRSYILCPFMSAQTNQMPFSFSISMVCTRFVTFATGV